MTNYDFPDVCLSESTDECVITPPDLASTRERLHKLPEGFTKTMVKSMRMAFPDKFATDEEAYMVYDAMKAVIATGLANGNKVHLDGLGEFSVQSEGGRKRVAFTAEECLNAVCK